MDLIYQNPRQKEKNIRLEMPISLLYSLRVIGRGSVNRLILEILREYCTAPDSKMVGRTTIEILDKLYYMWYPYPPKIFREEIITSKIGRFALMCPVHIYELTQKSALENLMSVKEFIVQVLINHLGWILEEDPFLFEKLQEALNTNPHAFRRPLLYLL